MKFARICLFALLALVAASPPLLGQNVVTGTITGSQCLPIQVTNQGVVGVSITGTWSGTIQPEISVGGDPPQNTTVTPYNSTTSQSTITANGMYQSYVAGATQFLVCGNTVTNTATVKLQSVPQSAGNGRGGGSGSAACVTTVSGLNSCPGQKNGTLATVTDGISATDCTVGGATGGSAHVVACQNNGTSGSPSWGFAGGSGSSPAGSLQLQYSNSGGTSLQAVPNVAAGSVLASTGASTVPAMQTKPVIDVRDYGVTGNGSTDDTTAMQSALTAACNSSGGVGSQLIIPSGARIKVSSTIIASKCLGLTVNGENSQGQTTYGANSNAALVWAGSAGGTVLEVNQTRDSDFSNFAIAAGNANIGLLIDEAGTVTSITTNNHFGNLAINNGAANSSWIAIDVCPSAPGNCEAQNFDRLLVSCAGSAPTSTSNGTGLKYEVAGGAEPYYEADRDLEINSCSTGIDLEGGFNIDIDGGLMSSNYTDLLLNGGSLVRYSNFRSESGTAQIVIGNTGASGLHDVTIENNAFSGLTASTTTISYPYSNTGGTIRLIKNVWDSSSSVIPFGKTGTGVFVGLLDSQDNTYPGTNSAQCISSAFSNSGLIWSSFDDQPFGGSCNYANGLIMGRAHGYVDVTPTTFGNFVSCASVNEGTIKAVSDSTTDVLGATITGGGSKHVFGYCNGTNWVVAVTDTPNITVQSGNTLTIASGATLTCAAGSTCPSGSLPSGTINQPLVNTSGGTSYATSSAETLKSSGVAMTGPNPWIDVTSPTYGALGNSNGTTGNGNNDGPAICSALKAGVGTVFIPSLSTSTTHYRVATQCAGQTFPGVRLSCGGANFSANNSTGGVEIDVDMGGVAGPWWIDGNPGSQDFNGIIVDNSCHIKDISTSQNSAGAIALVNISNARVNASIQGFELAPLGAPTNPSTLGSCPASTGGNIVAADYLNIQWQWIGPGGGSSKPSTITNVLTSILSGCSTGTANTFTPSFPATVPSTAIGAELFACQTASSTLGACAPVQQGLPYTCSAGTCNSAQVLVFGGTNAAATAITNLQTTSQGVDNFDHSGGYGVYTQGTIGQGCGAKGSGDSCLAADANQPYIVNADCQDSNFCWDFDAGTPVPQIDTFHINVSRPGGGYLTGNGVQSEGGMIATTGHVETLSTGTWTGTYFNLTGFVNQLNAIDMESGGNGVGINGVSLKTSTFNVMCARSLATCFQDDSNSSNNLLLVGDTASAGTITPQSSDCVIQSNAGTKFSSGCGVGNLSNPMTTLADIIYGGSSGTPTRLAGPTSPNSVPRTLTSTPSGGVAVAPAWNLPGISGRAVTGTTSTDTILATDCSPNRVEYVGSVAVAITLPTATTLAVPACVFKLVNNTTGVSTGLTVTPTTWTINGATSLVISPQQSAWIYVDPNSSTNWVADVNPLAPAFGPFVGAATIQGLSPYFVSDITSNGAGTPQSVYTVPTGYDAWTDVWCLNTSGSSVTWYEEFSVNGGTTYYLGGNPHIVAAGATAHDNTTGSMPAGTIYAINSSGTGLQCNFATYVAPAATMPARPILYTGFVQGDNVVYQCCATGTTYAHSVSGTGTGPLNGFNPQIFVTTLDTSSINFKLKLKRSGGSSTPVDATVACAFSATAPSGACVLSSWNSILQSGDEIIVNSNAGSSATGLSASESSSTVTVTSTLNPGVGSSVAMSGCTPTGYNSPVLNGVTQAFTVTASSGSSFQYTDTNTGLGAGSGCQAIWGPAGQLFAIEINEH